jgi:PAS domain S-box-containing protein
MGPASYSALCFLLATLSAAAAEPKRVLVVHSFGSAAPPFTTHSIAFETALTERMPGQVDLDEVSMDVARYTTLDMEEALLDFMRKRQAKWQADLVVPIGSPAGLFVANYRDRLFPGTTPVIYTGMDKRRLPPGALQQNAIFVGESFDFPNVVEDILQLAPATTNIAIVIGASPLERFWTDALRREYQIFTNRIRFTWFNDLAFDQMLQRAANMPPRSFLLLILLMRDATGVTHNADEALRRIREVANAPINGLFHHQLGLGIVGGRLYQAELEGVESARIAARVLQGESATNFQPLIIGPLEPRYDWRELRRWGIDESRLPRGSTVLFRQPTPWERYKWRIAGVVALVLLQGVVISFLLTNLLRRRRAERSLAESETRFRTVANAAPVMMWMSGTDKRCTFLNKAWLEFTGRPLERELGDGWSEGVHADDLPRCVRTYHEAFDARREFTMEYRLRKQDGEYAWILDRGAPRFIADIFAGYVGTATDITALKQAEERLRSVVEGAPNAMLVANAKGQITLVNARTEAVFGYTRAELIGKPADTLIPDMFGAQDPAKRQSCSTTLTARTMGVGREILGRRGDGSEVPLEIGLNTIRTPEGQFVLASIIDITERLAAEAKLHESDRRMALAAEAAHLGMWGWHEGEKALWASETWKSIHGYASNEEVRYDSLLKRIHPDDRAAVERAVDEAFRNHGRFYAQHRSLLPDGTTRWISASGRVERAGNNGGLQMLGVSIDITDRVEAEQAAREVSGKLINAQEDERRRIARELHDDLNQRLALLSIEADLLGRMEHDPAAQNLVNEIATRVRGLSTEVHKLSYQLHPAKLEQLGLVAALRSFCTELKKQCNVPIEFVHENVPRDLNRDVALCFYRIVQEALQNTVKHSGATTARIELRKIENNVQLVVADNGRGFDPGAAAHHAGLGLTGMRERARLVRGRIALQSAPGKGTRIEVNVAVPVIDLDGR